VIAASLIAVLLSTTTGQAPTVTLETPASGWTTSRVVNIKGQVSDASLRLATLCVNGTERPLPLQNGSYDVPLVLSPGVNVIEVTAANASGEGKAKASVFA